MEQKQMIAGIVVVALVATIAFVGFVVLNPNLHYEEYSDNASGTFYLSVENFEDTDITISFVNDSTLLYDIDIERYPDSPVVNVYRDSSFQNMLDFEAESWGRIKSMDIVLGTGVMYNFYIVVRNTTTNITYSNGAILGERCYFLGGTSEVHFTLDEDVTFDDVGSEIIIACETITVNVDLPEGLEGKLTAAANTVTAQELIGWFKRDPVGLVYSTVLSPAEPFLDLSFGASSILATLTK